MRGFAIVVLSNATVKSSNVLECGTVLVGNLLFAVLALSYNCSVTFSIPTSIWLLLLRGIPRMKTHTHTHTQSALPAFQVNVFGTWPPSLMFYTYMQGNIRPRLLLWQTAPAEMGGPHSPSFPPPRSFFLSPSVVLSRCSHSCLTWSQPADLNLPISSGAPIFTQFLVPSPRFLCFAWLLSCAASLWVDKLQLDVKI